MQGIGENFPSWSSVKGRRCPCCPLPMRSMVGLWFSHPSSGYALYLSWLGARDVRKMCGESAAQVERDSRGEEALAGVSKYLFDSSVVFLLEMGYICRCI